MIEKALYVIIFMYLASFGVLAAQWYADAYGIVLKNNDGDEFESNILSFINEDTFNSNIQNFTLINQTTAEGNPITAAAEAAWDMFQLLTGTYIFNLLILMGMPSIVVYPLLTIYGFLVIRTFIAYFRGI